MNKHQVTSLTGGELQMMRRKAGMNQTSMAKRIGCSRHAVSYWETKSMISHKAARYGVPKRMCEVLGIEVLPNYHASKRARGDGVLYPNTHGRGDGVLVWPPFTDWQQAALDRENARQIAKAKAQAARHRQPCGATTRKGQPCRNKSEPGRRRCKFHGGRSTGPRTPEGKARIAAAQRTRWAVYRAAKELAPTAQAKTKT